MTTSDPDASTSAWPASTPGPEASSRTQLGDEAASFIRDLITSGALAPGAPVRPDVVASSLGISATPAREALQALRTEGLLELAPRRGFTVANITSDDIRDIFFVQSLVAGELAARAALNATPDQLEKLKSMHTDLVLAAERGDMVDLDVRYYAFHREIDMIGGSPKLAWVLELVSRYVPKGFHATIEGWPQATINDHMGLLDALLKRDAAAARLRQTEHVVRAGERLAERVYTRSATP